MTAVFADADVDHTAASVEPTQAWPQARERTAGAQVGVSRLDELKRRSVASDRQNIATIGRVVDLGLLLARMEGVEPAEVAHLLGTSVARLTSWVHQTEAIPRRKGDRVVEMLAIVADLHKVIERRGTARWLRLKIPELHGRTPLEEIARGRVAEVQSLVRSYLDPSYS